SRSPEKAPARWGRSPPSSPTAKACRPMPPAPNTALPKTDSFSNPIMRTAEITRNTSETQIRVAVNLDGTGRLNVDTGVPFLDHMLDQIARHGLIDLDIQAKGDLHIDAHHTVEDVGIALGQAFAQAVGNKAGIRRYGHAYVPLDEA